MLISRKSRRSTDRHGRLRSPVTESRYRRGKEPANKGRKFPPHALRVGEVLAMIEACPPGYAGTRNAAMIVVMWRAGLRAAELVALRPVNLQLDAGRLHVERGKGDKARTVGIDPGAAPLVERWLSARSELGIGAEAPLFCTVSRPYEGEPLFTQGVRQAVSSAAARAGITKRVSPHVLRHTHAYELLEEGFRLDYIRRQLGHASSATTWRYLEHLNPAEVIDAIRSRRFPN